MQITVKMRTTGVVAAVRETIEAVRPGLGAAASVSEVFPGVTSGNRAGMVVVELGAASAADANAVLQALKDRDDVVYAEAARGRRAR